MSPCLELRPEPLPGPQGTDSAATGRQNRTGGAYGQVAADSGVPRQALPREQELSGQPAADIL